MQKPRGCDGSSEYVPQNSNPNFISSIRLASLASCAKQSSGDAMKNPLPNSRKQRWFVGRLNVREVNSFDRHRELASGATRMAPLWAIASAKLGGRALIDLRKSLTSGTAFGFGMARVGFRLSASRSVRRQASAVVYPKKNAMSLSYWTFGKEIGSTCEKTAKMMRNAWNDTAVGGYSAMVFPITQDPTAGCCSA